VAGKVTGLDQGCLGRRGIHGDSLFARYDAQFRGASIAVPGKRRNGGRLLRGPFFERQLPSTGAGPPIQSDSTCDAGKNGRDWDSLVSAPIVQLEARASLQGTPSRGASCCGSFLVRLFWRLKDWRKGLTFVP
jgi:hypothetical protein